MSDIEEFYFDHENVLVFTNLDDIGQPYSCADWGDRGVQFGASPLITDDGPGSDLWGKFNTGNFFPSVAFIDHTMTVHYKQSGGPSLALTQSIINQMLDKLYNSLLLSANFEIDFNNDIDSDGLINPGDSFNVIIHVMNKSYNEDNLALNVNLELSSDCDGITITSSNLGQIGNISSGDTYQVEANIAIDESVIIDDYFLNLVIETDNIDEEGELVYEEFSTDFSITLNQQGFPVDMSGELISSAAIVDIDNDGQDEIISSDKGGFVHVFEMDGTEWVDDTFPYYTEDQNWGSPAVGDLDGDEFDDVVISSKNGHIYVFGSSSGLLLDFDSDSYVTATPALGDIDGDGLDEIIFGQYGGSKRLYAINADGSDVAGFPIDLDQKVQRGVALADFNGNGKADIVVGTDDEFIHLIYDDGSIAWSYETGGDIRVAPTVLELNTGEKIVLTGSKDDNFYALNSDGSVRFMIETDDDISTEASVVDIDGVGPVIFFASGSMVYGVESDGDIYGDWPINIGSDITSSIVFSKIGNATYIMFGDESGTAHIYHIHGNTYDNFPISYSFPFKGSPTILDTDGDGDLEFLIGSTQTLTNIDIKEAGIASGLWNTHRADMNRSGYYLSTIDALDVSDDIIENYEFALYNAYPNPFNPTTTIEFEVPYSMDIILNIYDISGRLVKTLVDDIKYPGLYSAVWDGTDQYGNNVANGLYVYKLMSNQNISISNKMILIK